jgi:hypothetical protein
VTKFAGHVSYERTGFATAEEKNFHGIQV